MELYFLARCAQMMLLKQCIRRAVQEGLVRHFPISIHAMFFFPQIQFILQCPPSWRALQLLNLLHLVDRRSMWVRWSGRILNGHVLRRVGLQSEPYVYIYIRYFLSIQLHIYIYHLLFLHAGSCTCRDGEPFQQRIGDGTGQGPQPVLIESNKMLFFNAFFFVLTVRMFRLCILGLLRNHLQTRRIGS